MRILLVDDDELLARNLALSLTAQHYAVDVASDGISGWDYSQAATYDLIVLDVNLPLLDGISLCQRLRKSGYRQLILLLTARGSSSDKVIGLDAGADDYVVKPCTVEELCARIRALFRRQQPSATPVLEWGQFCLDPRVCEITFRGQLLPLSPKEYGLLELFLRNPNRVFSSSHILENLWGFEETPGEETVRTHIKRLRRKLKQVGAETAIENIYGMGYRLKALTEELSEASPEEQPSPLEASEKQPSSETQARKAAIAAWDHLKGLAFERVAILDLAVTAIQSGALSTELREQAESAAHKLAGSLGMFGFAHGSQLGRAIESWFHTPDWETSHQVQSLVKQLHQELENPPGLSEIEPSPPIATIETKTAIQVTDRPTSEIAIVLVASAKLEWVHPLAQDAIAMGMTVIQTASIAEAKQYIRQNLPLLIVIDLTETDRLQERWIWLEELAVSVPQLSILVLTTGDELTDRLQITRRNRRASLCHTLTAPQILDAIQDVLQSLSYVAKVLAVDDDPIVLEMLNCQLPQHGIQVKTLLDPHQFWNALDANAPDLLILDVDLPDINGVELCQMIRTHPTWKRLPIVFLTAYRDAEIVQHLFSVGADDYIAKSVTETELVTRILSRLERHRVLNSIAEQDALTGLANRWRSTQEMNRYLSLSCRYKQPMCLAIVLIQINHCSQENWQNQLLKQIATILQTLFRSEDVIARWHPNLFLIGLYGIRKQQASERVKQALAKVQQTLEPTLVTSSISMTIATGIAEAPTEGIDLQTLHQAAQVALEESIAIRNASR